VHYTGCIDSGNTGVPHGACRRGIGLRCAADGVPSGTTEGALCFQSSLRDACPREGECNTTTSPSRREGRNRAAAGFRGGSSRWNTERASSGPPRRLVPELRPSRRQGAVHSAQIHLRGATESPNQSTRCHQTKGSWVSFQNVPVRPGGVGRSFPSTRDWCLSPVSLAGYWPPLVVQSIPDIQPAVLAR
jgi:hypothetical protein